MSEQTIHSLTPETAAYWALVPAAGGACLVSRDGEVETVERLNLAARLAQEPVLLCHRPFVERRMGLAFGSLGLHHFDVTELFAFVLPAQFVAPSPVALCRFFELEPPRTVEDQALSLFTIQSALLATAASLGLDDGKQARSLAGWLAQHRWPWAPMILSTLANRPEDKDGGSGLDVWTRLPFFEDQRPPDPPGNRPVTAVEAATRLSELLARDPASREERSQQVAYTKLASAAFEPPAEPGEPKVVLAEAGTGTGKTLGYLAPAQVWTEWNGGSVWIATYTKALQRQLDHEFDLLFPSRAEKNAAVTVRKGRENYICLLNYQEAVTQGQMAPLGLALTARWLAHTRDGDMIGGDFPSWLFHLMGRGASVGGEAAFGGLTDRRGECIYAACPHYRRCFIERNVRDAKDARFVIANHAILMIEALRRRAQDTEDDEEARLFPPIVFDEGHHLFDAADSAFSIYLTLRECADLRLWIRGAEGGRRPSRRRGLADRAEDLLRDDPAAWRVLQDVLAAAGTLPLNAQAAEGPLAEMVPAGERFFGHVERIVRARSGADARSRYDLEADLFPADGLFKEAARDFAADLRALGEPLAKLAHMTRARLDVDAAKLDSELRVRLEALARGLEHRARDLVSAWVMCLDQFDYGASDTHIDRLVILKSGGRVADLGLVRQWRDPALPLAEFVLKKSRGALITSATLTQKSAGTGEWGLCEHMTGAQFVGGPISEDSFASPFDYAEQARIFIVNDVEKNDRDASAAAYRELFLASGGSALGLFTAIRRLTDTFERIAAPLEEAGIALYAQHIDPIDPGTLADLFRADEHSCLLGTDTMREGLDVPGPALKLAVLDRMPWPVPSIQHRERRDLFGGKAYDEHLTRLRLRQAFGRLIRTKTDKGVFVILDRQTPSRFLDAFPDTAPVRRVGLAEAIAETRAFLGQ